MEFDLKREGDGDLTDPATPVPDLHMHGLEVLLFGLLCNDVGLAVLEGGLGVPHRSGRNVVANSVKVAVCAGPFQAGFGEIRCRSLSRTTGRGRQRPED